MRVAALAVEQRPAEFVFQELDGAGERGLRDMALLGRAREIELLADREKVAHLLHFHGGRLAFPAAYWFAAP